MMSEEKIRVLLQDIKTVHAVGTRLGDIDTSSEKMAQIEILEWILDSNKHQSQHHNEHT